MNEITPAELYKLQPQECSYDILRLEGYGYYHVPEVDITWEMSEENERLQRIQIRILKYQYIDDRRYWELATVWFDNEPVMITQNAGREGNDHVARFITNSDAYFTMMSYIRSLISDTIDQLNNDVIDPDVPRDDLLSFYNGSLITNRILD